MKTTGIILLETNEATEKLFNYPPWDWLAVILAFLSFAIAICAFIVAFKTLRSQQKTEKNTTPLISIPIQEFLLCQIFIRLFYGYMKVNAVKKINQSLLYQTYFSDFTSDDITPDVNDIHVELFYSDKEKYITIRGLFDAIRSYNNAVDSFFVHQKQGNVEWDALENEVNAILRRANSIVGYIECVMYGLFGYNTNQLCDVLYEVMTKTSNVKLEGNSRFINPEYQEKAIALFNYQESAFAKLFVKYGDGKKEELVSFMNDFTMGLLDRLLSEIVLKEKNN